MPHAFSVYPGDSLPGDTSGLREHIAERVESEREAASILRSIQRYGTDTSIRYFEMTPSQERLGMRTAQRVAWNVRAVRF